MNKAKRILLIVGACFLAGCGRNIEVAAIGGDNLKPSQYKCRLGVLYVTHRNGISAASNKDGGVISCTSTEMTRGEVKDLGLWY